jgi:hypothetical protein
MGSFIHARRTPVGMRYRIWSTIVDAYTTDVMDECALRRELMRDYSPREREYGVPDRDILARLERAHRNGTSEMNFEGPSEIDEPWETERCDGCGGFHHAYKPCSDGTCGHCGELGSDRSHGPACVGASGGGRDG